MKYYVSLFKIIFTLSIAIIITMFIRVEFLSFTNDKEVSRYLVASMKYNSHEYKIPYFKDREFRSVVSKYILNNDCNYLDYHLFKLHDDKSSLFLDCGKKVEYIFDFKNKKVLNFYDIVNNKEKFDTKVRDLLYLKYPYFVVDNIIEEGIYNINNYELTGYFKTKEYGNLTVKINNNEINGLLDYDMKYTDSYENEEFKIDRNKKLIAFTYDDGPSQYDLKTVDILNRSHFKATFFIVGTRINDYQDVIKYLISNEMEVGNHTFSHKVLSSLSEEEATNEITLVNDMYKGITNNDLKLFRPSYGISNTKVVKKLNMPVILWSIDTLDWKTKNTNLIYKSIMDDPRDGDIVLMHSLYESTEKATEKAVKELYKKGFIVVSVSDLMKYRGMNLNAGEIYHCVNCNRDY